MATRAPIDDGTREALKVFRKHWSSAPPEERPDFDSELPLIELPGSAYRPPAFLASTASRRLQGELRDLLDELQAFNRLFVGEPTGIAILQAHDDPGGWFLARSFLDWANAYADERLAKPNPRDRSAYHRFVRLRDEFVALLRPLLENAHTLNRVLLHPARDRLRLRAYQATMAPFMQIERSLQAMAAKAAGADVDLLAQIPIDPVPGWDVDMLDHGQMALELIRTGLPFDSLRTAYTLLQQAIPAAPVRATRRELQARLARTVADLHALRPFLRWTDAAYATTVSGGGELHLRWSWKIGILGALKIAPPDQLDSKFLANEKDIARYAVDFDGQPLEFPPQARVLADFPEAEGLHFLELHVEALELLLQEFYAVWDRLHAQRGRALAEKDDEEAQVAAAASALAAPDGERVAGERIAALRFNRLCTALSRLGVEVRQGKGSEVVLARAGRRFTLAHHTRNPVVWPGVVRSILRKLEIPLEAFAALGEAG